MFQFKRFIPIEKVDKAKRMTYGFASTDEMDSDGEIVELEALKKAMPSYMQFPAVREMHQNSAVGTTKNAEIKDEKGRKGMYIGAKIVDDSAWKKVQEGVYRGFSIGGDIIQKIGNRIKEIDLVEISLVDVPANKSAKIELFKRDFSAAERKDLAGSGKAMPDGSFPIENRKDLEDAIRAIGRAKDPAAARAHIRSRARSLGLSNLIPDSWGKKADSVSMTKNAHSMTALHSLMNHVRDTADHLQMHGKSKAVKQLDGVTEKMKALIADEAGEEEAERPQPGKSPAVGPTNYPGEGMMGGIYMSRHLTDRAAAIEKLQFDTPLQKLLQKEVISVLKNEANKLEKGDDPKDEGKSEEKTEETADGEKAEEKSEEKTGETADEEKDEEKTGEKKAAATTTLEKIGSVNKRLAALEPVEELAKEKLGLQKAVVELANGFEKMTSVLERIEKRISKLESTPAALKTKSVAVYRNDAEKEDMTKTKEQKNSALSLKKGRLAELETLYTQLGPSEYAHRGLGNEAGRLMQEIEDLQRKQG